MTIGLIMLKVFIITFICIFGIGATWLNLEKGLHKYDDEPKEKLDE